MEKQAKEDEYTSLRRECAEVGKRAQTLFASYRAEEADLPEGLQSKAFEVLIYKGVVKDAFEELCKSSGHQHGQTLDRMHEIAVKYEKEAEREIELGEALKPHRIKEIKEVALDRYARLDTKGVARYIIDAGERGDLNIERESSTMMQLNFLRRINCQVLSGELDGIDWANIGFISDHLKECDRVLSNEGLFLDVVDAKTRVVTIDEAYDFEDLKARREAIEEEAERLADDIYEGVRLAVKYIDWQHSGEIYEVSHDTSLDTIISLVRGFATGGATVYDNRTTIEVDREVLQEIEEYVQERREKMYKLGVIAGVQEQEKEYHLRAIYDSVSVKAPRLEGAELLPHDISEYLTASLSHIFGNIPRPLYRGLTGFRIVRDFGEEADEMIGRSVALHCVDEVDGILVRSAHVEISAAEINKEIEQTIEILRKVITEGDFDDVELRRIAIRVVRLRIFYMILHELGHHVHSVISFQERLRWEEVLDDIYVSAQVEHSVRWEARWDMLFEGARKIGGVREKEDFADTFAIFIYDLAVVAGVSKGRYEYMRNLVSAYVKSSENLRDRIDAGLEARRAEVGDLDAHIERFRLFIRY